MTIYEQHQQGLRELQGELGADCPVMWYNGGAIRVFAGGASYKSKNSQGGLSLNCDLKLTVLAADFGTGFNFDALTNQTFNYPGQTGNLYSVDSVVKISGGFQVSILANSAAEGL